MEENLYLGLKKNQLVLFADILGFKNEVKDNATTSLYNSCIDAAYSANGNVLTVDFRQIFNHINDKYSLEKQTELQIKFLWVSDSIIVSTHKNNTDTLFAVLDDITSILYTSSFSLRGGIALGDLYHENNIWGPAYIDAVEIESKLAVYPRILIQEAVINTFEDNSRYLLYVEKCEQPAFYQYDYFKSCLAKIANDEKDIISPISLYGKFILRSFENASSTELIEKYVWLAEKLVKAINENSQYLDNYLEKCVKMHGKGYRVSTLEVLVEQLKGITISR